MDNQRIAAFARLIVPFYALVNSFLLSVGYNPMPFSDEEVTAAVNTVIGAVDTVRCAWLVPMPSCARMVVEMPRCPVKYAINAFARSSRSGIGS